MLDCPWIGVRLSLPYVVVICCYPMLCYASYSPPSLLNSWQLFAYLEFCVICSSVQHLATDTTFVCINLVLFYNVCLCMCLYVCVNVDASMLWCSDGDQKQTWDVDPWHPPHSRHSLMFITVSIRLAGLWASGNSLSSSLSLLWDHCDCRYSH